MSSCSATSGMTDRPSTVTTSWRRRPTRRRRRHGRRAERQVVGAVGPRLEQVGRDDQLPAVGQRRSDGRRGRRRDGRTVPRRPSSPVTTKVSLCMSGVIELRREWDPRPQRGCPGERPGRKCRSRRGRDGRRPAAAVTLRRGRYANGGRACRGARPATDPVSGPAGRAAPAVGERRDFPPTRCRPPRPARRGRRRNRAPCRLPRTSGHGVCLVITQENRLHREGQHHEHSHDRPGGVPGRRPVVGCMHDMGSSASTSGRRAVDVGRQSPARAASRSRATPARRRTGLGVPAVGPAGYHPQTDDTQQYHPAARPPSSPSNRPSAPRPPPSPSHVHPLTLRRPRRLAGPSGATPCI